MADKFTYTTGDLDTASMWKTRTTEQLRVALKNCRANALHVKTMAGRAEAERLINEIARELEGRGERV